MPIMHLQIKLQREETENETLYSILTWERRDNTTDALPMMNSIIWPIGLKKESKVVVSSLFKMQCFLGLGFILSMLNFNGLLLNLGLYR